MFASPIARLVQQLAKLPGIGEKTAARLAFHILRARARGRGRAGGGHHRGEAEDPVLRVCCDLTERDPCAICGTRAGTRAWSAWSPSPRTWSPSSARGAIAGATTSCTAYLSPLDGIGPDDLRVAELVRRCCGAADGPIREVILATSPNVEGEATAVYISKLLRPLGVRATRIATGVPIGGELEYADQVTLARAIDGRREM